MQYIITAAAVIGYCISSRTMLISAYVCMRLIDFMYQTRSF